LFVFLGLRFCHCATFRVVLTRFCHCVTFRVVLTRFCNSQSHAHQARCNSQRRIHKAKCNSTNIHVRIHTYIHIYTHTHTTCTYAQSCVHHKSRSMYVSQWYSSSHMQLSQSCALFPYKHAIPCLQRYAMGWLWLVGSIKL
jgi:hypothetical protein